MAYNMTPRPGYVIITDPRTDKPTYGQPIQIPQATYVQMRQQAQQMSQPKGSQGGNQVAGLAGQAAGTAGTAYLANQLMTQGTSQLAQQGTAQLATQGTTQLATQGTTQLATQGTGQLAAQGSGQLAAQGGAQAGTTAASSGASSTLATVAPWLAAAPMMYETYQAHKRTKKNADGKGTTGGVKQGWKDAGWLKYTGTPAIYNAAVGGIVGTFGSKKHKDQQARDRVRKRLREGGALDENYNLTLADGTKYGIGADGKSLANPALRNYNVDFSRENAGQDVAAFNPLAAILGGGNQKLTSDYAGYFTNAANSSGDKQANLKKFYQDAGLDHNKAYQAVLELSKQKRIDDATRDAYLNGLDQTFGMGAYAKGGRAYQQNQPQQQNNSMMPKMQPQGGVAPRVQPKQWSAMTPQMQGQIQARPNPAQGMQRPPVQGRPMQPMQQGGQFQQLAQNYFGSGAQGMQRPQGEIPIDGNFSAQMLQGFVGGASGNYSGQRPQGSGYSLGSSSGNRFGQGANMAAQYFAGQSGQRPQVQPKTWQPMQAGMQGQMMAQPRQLTPEQQAELQARYGQMRGMLAQPPRRY